MPLPHPTQCRFNEHKTVLGVLLPILKALQYLHAKVWGSAIMYVPEPLCKPADPALSCPFNPPPLIVLRTCVGSRIKDGWLTHLVHPNASASLNIYMNPTCALPEKLAPSSLPPRSARLPAWLLPRPHAPPRLIPPQGIAHRDIKTENILLTSTGVIKLADFGLAIDTNEERAVTRAGTLDYMVSRRRSRPGGRGRRGAWKERGWCGALGTMEERPVGPVWAARWITSWTGGGDWNGG